jgi:hypothetical protein
MKYEYVLLAPLSVKGIKHTKEGWKLIFTMLDITIYQAKRSIISQDGPLLTIAH